MYIFYKLKTFKDDKSLNIYLPLKVNPQLNKLITKPCLTLIYLKITRVNKKLIKEHFGFKIFAKLHTKWHKINITKIVF